MTMRAAEFGVGPALTYYVSVDHLASPPFISHWARQNPFRKRGKGWKTGESRIWPRVKAEPLFCSQGHNFERGRILTRVIVLGGDADRHKVVPHVNFSRVTVVAGPTKGPLTNVEIRFVAY
jgi:hypothetical protein